MKRIIPIFAALVLAAAIPIQSANAKQTRGAATLNSKPPVHLQAKHSAKRLAKRQEARLEKKHARKHAKKLARRQALKNRRVG